MKPLSIRTRLTLGYLVVLSIATLTLAGSAWMLFRLSIARAARREPGRAR